MKYQITAPPSITEQEIIVDITEQQPVSTNTPQGLLVTVPAPSVSHTISGTTPPDVEVPNIPPIANAGSSQTIQLPVNSVVLNGSGTDSDGNITAYQWSKIAGGAASILTPNSAVTTVTGLTEGQYSFQLAVTDNDGATNTSITTVTVKAAVIVEPPVGYSLIYSNGFDKTADLDPQGHEQYGNGYIDNTFFKTGPASFHSLPKDVSSGIRSEVQFNAGFVPIEGAVEYDVYYKKMAANNAHSFQFHPGTGGASACPGLWHRSSTLYITFKLPSSTPEKVVFKPVLNTWYNIRHEYKMSTGSDGYWRVYVDGVLRAEYTGRTAYDNSWYLKLGVNMWSQAATNSDVYYDNLKIYKK